MAIKLDWKRGDKVIPDVYARLSRNTRVCFEAYLTEKGAPMVPAAVATREAEDEVTPQASLNAAEVMVPSRAAQGAAVAEEDGMIRRESGLAALAFYRLPDDRENGFDPIGGTRVDLPAGPLLDAVFTRMEAGDTDGAVAAIYAAAKARMAECPYLAADFLNLRDA